MWNIEDALSSLSNEGLLTSHCLTQDGLGKDSHFLSIYVVDMFFKTNVRICLQKKKMYYAKHIICKLSMGQFILC